MKNIILLLGFLLLQNIAFSQDSKTIAYDEALAKKLGADEYGMKQYVFCLLKTGTNTTATSEEFKKAFEGHMSNIGKLAKEGKLVLAGPFMKNDKNYRGIYIFNVSTIEEAQELVKTDPAISTNILEAELTLWYGSAGLQELNDIHSKISKTKF